MVATGPAQLPAVLPKGQTAGAAFGALAPKSLLLGFLPLGRKDGKINIGTSKKCLLQKISQHNTNRHQPQQKFLPEQTCVGGKVLWPPSNSSPERDWAASPSIPLSGPLSSAHHRAGRWREGGRGPREGGTWPSHRRHHHHHQNTTELVLRGQPQVGLSQHRARQVLSQHPLNEQGKEEATSR